MAQFFSTTFGTSATDILTLMITLYMVICLTFSVITKILPKLLSRKALQSSKRILLVIAHPDDECLFFGPTVLALLREYRQNFYVLCLSNGDYEGKGIQRKNELWSSCRAMGILSENVILIKHDHLRDDPKAHWSYDLIGRMILPHVNSLQIDTLITFDGYGVSGHKNHSAIYFSVEELVNQGKIPRSCTSYALESVNVIRKYVPTILDFPFSYLTSSIIYVTEGNENSLIQEAMHQHHSQFVWFRRLYLIFSRYIKVNTLRQISGSRRVNDNRKRR